MRVPRLQGGRCDRVRPQSRGVDEDGRPRHLSSAREADRAERGLVLALRARGSEARQLAEARAVKVLSLTQPWASLVAIGAKQIETRSWRTHYRGPLLIHASAGFPGECR